MADYEIISDNGTPPVMLARAPGQVADQGLGSGAIVFRGAKSGNRNFDPLTGRFAGAKAKMEVVAQTIQPGALPTVSGVPTGVDPIAWSRRMAAVRDAARSLQDLTAETIKDFLAARVADVNQVDINQFLADAQWQRIADLADVLDRKMHTGLPVKVVAPNKWVTQVFRNLDSAQAGHLVKTLEGRGWDAADVKSKIIMKIRNPDLKKQLLQLYGEELPHGKKAEKPPTVPPVPGIR